MAIATSHATFFEFSPKKLGPVVGILFGIFGALLLFLIVDEKYSLQERSSNYVKRSWYEFSYILNYKMPGSFAAAVGLTHTPVSTPDAQKPAYGIPVLVYHGEGGASDMPFSIFVNHMRLLKADGWQTITMEQFEDFMKNGKSLPQKSFLLTYDDGRKDTFYHSDPVLKDLGFNAVMFVITGDSLPQVKREKETTYYLTESELRYMSESGRWELESHGDKDHNLYAVPTADSTPGNVVMDFEGHFLSNLFWVQGPERFETTDEYKKRVSEDLLTSKAILEKTFGKSIIGFAYPFNDFGQGSINLPEAQELLGGPVSSAYMFAFRQVDAKKVDILNYPDKNSYVVKRIEPPASWSGTRLVEILDSAIPKELPYTQNIFGEEWNQSWGKVTTDGGILRLSATDQTTGATAFLSGTQEWKNYTLRTRVNWHKGKDVSLVARWRDTTRSYLTCTFSNDQIYLETHAGTIQTIIAKAPYRGPKEKTGVELSMKVSGPQVTCIGDGGSVTGSITDATYAKGGIGMSIWDSTMNTATIEVTKISVTPL